MRKLINGQYVNASQIDIEDITSGQASQKMSLITALGKLDRSIDAHWTKGGLPDLNAVSELVGVRVSRPDIKAIAANFKRGNK